MRSLATFAQLADQLRREWQPRLKKLLGNIPGASSNQEPDESRSWEVQFEALWIGSDAAKEMAVCSKWRDREKAVTGGTTGDTEGSIPCTWLEKHFTFDLKMFNLAQIFGNIFIGYALPFEPSCCYSNYTRVRKRTSVSNNCRRNEVQEKASDYEVSNYTSGQKLFTRRLHNDRLRTGEAIDKRRRVNHGRARRMRIELNMATTPRTLLGISRRMA